MKLLFFKVIFSGYPVLINQWVTLKLPYALLRITFLGNPWKAGNAGLSAKFTAHITNLPFSDGVPEKAPSRLPDVALD
jgi:hypothetical protein